jgi:hypothetical protein
MADVALQICKDLGITTDDVKKLEEKNKQLSELDKEVKDLKDKIKKAMISANADKCTFGNVELRVTYQNRDSLDEELLVKLMEEKGLDDALLTIKKPDPNKLTELLGSGQLSEQDIASCMIPNRIAVLKFPKAKKETETNKAVNNIVNNKKTGGMF